MLCAHRHIPYSIFNWLALDNTRNVNDNSHLTGEKYSLSFIKPTPLYCIIESEIFVISNDLLMRSAPHQLLKHISSIFSPHNYILISTKKRTVLST